MCQPRKRSVLTQWEKGHRQANGGISAMKWSTAWKWMLGLFAAILAAQAYVFQSYILDSSLSRGILRNFVFARALLRSFFRGNQAGIGFPRTVCAHSGRPYSDNRGSFCSSSTGLRGPATRALPCVANPGEGNSRQHPEFAGQNLRELVRRHRSRFVQCELKPEQ